MARRLRRWLPWLMAVSDTLLIIAAFAVAFWMRYRLQWFRAVDPAFSTTFRAYIPLAALLTGFLLIAYRGAGLYDHRRTRSWLGEMRAIINGTAIGIVTLVFIVFFARPLAYSRLIFFYAAFSITIFLGISRLVKAIVLARLRRSGRAVDRVLIVGAGEIGRTVMRNLVAQPELGYQVVGFVDDNPDKAQTDIGRFRALGSVDNLPRILEQECIDEVIIALPWQAHRKIIRLVNECQRADVHARIIPDLFQMSLSQVDVDDINGIPLIGVREVRLTGVNLAIKRVVDVVVAVVSLALALPLMLLIALVIRLDSPGPVLFPQERMGRGGRLFTMHKFRSMVEGADAEQEALSQAEEVDGRRFKLKDDPRVTRVGRFLRRTSLDELPQLFNVLRGEMSLVGPRPALPAEVTQYQEWHKKRQEIVPGLTGLWQVSGRSEIPFDEMVLLDIYYIENWSLGLDSRILLQTIPKVIFGEGAY
ncbi:MAG: undecaprenyl-phosphate glucose phosphotransferase, partial [Chloroflexi bacterium]|nr:undecaprenyl-phosphate glucose phosphotransferase [Chloroflexota bacterium]